MKYIDLTEDQKESLAKTTLMLRQTAGEFARLANKLDFATRGLGYEYMVGLIQTLDNATVEDGPQLVPNPDITGELRGATYLSKERILELIQLAEAIKALNTSSIKTACVEAVGPFKVLN